MTTTRHTILVVDDEELNRKLLGTMLKPEGYDVVLVESGEEALASVKISPPDLILLDLMMPGMNGFEVAKELKRDASTSNIPIVMVTAQTDSIALLEGLEAGVEEFLTKPVQRLELWLRVRNLLRLKELRDTVETYSHSLESDIASRTVELQRFRNAMDETGDAVFLLDLRTRRFVDVNATATKMFGYSRREFLLFGEIDLPPSTHIALERLVEVLMSTGPGDTLATAKIACRDNSSVTVEVFRQSSDVDESDMYSISIVRDVTDRELAHLRLFQMAHHDALTGLPNRTLFYETLTRTLERAGEKGWTAAVLFIDIDFFKKVNDVHGHAAGDALLCQVANRLLGSVRLRDTVGRLGGDEFAVILVMEGDGNNAIVIAEKIKSVLSEPLTILEDKVRITASIGIASYPSDAVDAESLITFADTAMYKAKKNGRDQIAVFTEQMSRDLSSQLRVESALLLAMEEEQFVVYYQPKVDVRTNKICGLEALLRWQRPGHGLTSPKYFIPILEESGLIVQVGSWVIDKVCQQIKNWSSGDIGDVPVSVNVSGRQLMHNDLRVQVLQSLNDSGINGSLLELELTESLMMQNTEETIAILTDMKNRGIEYSIDDFGTGFSSLASLHRFPIDKVKIDIAFVRQIAGGLDEPTMAQTIIQMAHGLNMQVVAEGVETVAQFDYLRHHGCDQIQGYLFSPPLALVEIEELLRKEAANPTFSDVVGTDVTLGASVD